MDDRRRQIRRDIDRYLTDRRKTGGWFKSQPKPQSPLHPTIQTYKNTMNTDNTEEQKEEKPPGEMETDYETAKKGWLSSMVDKLFGAEASEVNQDELALQTAPSLLETTDDLKEIARISLHVLRQMEGDQIKDFKQTPDYEKFKDILRKHNLIK